VYNIEVGLDKFLLSRRVVPVGIELLDASLTAVGISLAGPCPLFCSVVGEGLDDLEDSTFNVEKEPGCGCCDCEDCSWDSEGSLE
jgi:hypothetical protein